MNETFDPAMDLYSQEICVVTTKRVMCDGGGGALGHPRTYYDMGQNDYVDCKYCDQRFVLKGSAYDLAAMRTPDLSS